MDLYRATGDPRYLHAVEGALGALSRQVGEPRRIHLHHRVRRVSAQVLSCCTPSWKSFAGMSFWAFLSQRFHLLDPENEKYVTEIEKSIYNVAMANQAGSEGFRYHALLAHRKEKPTQMNTCCEGQGTRLIGSLPEHIYSLASDGVYVNLFEPSTLHWTEGGASLRLKMATQVPVRPRGSLAVLRGDGRRRRKSASVCPPGPRTKWPCTSMASRRLRASPAAMWCSTALGQRVILRASRCPRRSRAERYTGVDQIPDHERYAVSFGPILLAAVGAPEIRLRLEKVRQPEDLLKHLQPKPGQPLHYLVENNPGRRIHALLAGGQGALQLLSCRGHARLSAGGPSPSCARADLTRISHQVSGRAGL